MIVVPAAEGLVGGWRADFDPSAAEGMPAHVTLLYPFLPANRLDEAVLTDLAELCAAVPAVDVAFERVAELPGVVYLAPEPSDPLEALTTRIAERWPEAPPYGGAHDEVIPHLTVAQYVDRATAAEIERDVEARLPLRTRLAHASLFVSEAGHWTERTRFPFGE